MDNSTFRPDNTNVLTLMDAQLGKYAAGPAIYKCPADHSLSKGNSGEPRIRSISMNGYMGQRSGPYSSGYKLFKNINDISDPAPSRAFLFIDEREDSINDPCFLSDMGSYGQPIGYSLVDCPADWHDRGANLSFVDGHVENWHWQDSRTMPPHMPGRLIPLGIASPNNPDIGRLQEVTSRRVFLPQPR